MSSTNRVPEETIVYMLTSGKKSSELSKELGMSTAAAREILTGRTYKNVRPDIPRYPRHTKSDMFNYCKRKFTEKEVVYMLTSTQSHGVLAKELNASRQVISKIRLGLFYRDVRPDIPRPVRTVTYFCTQCIHYKQEKCLMEVPEFDEMRTRAASICNLYTKHKKEDTHNIDGTFKEGHKVGPRFAKGNQWGKLNAGSRCHSAILTEEDVLKIREDYANGMTVKEIMNYTGMAENTIRAIVKRKSWKHI
jgi:hypothetical protein